MDQSMLDKSKKDRTWMQECKEIIRLQFEALKNIQIKNQQLQQQLEQSSLKVRLGIEREENFKIQIERLQQQLQTQLNKNKIDSPHVQENKALKINNQRCLQDLEKANLSILALEQSLKNKETDNLELNKSLKSTKIFLNEAQTHMTFLKTQIQTMRSKMHSQERHYEEEIQALKDLNTNLKRQFEMIQRDYSQILKTSEEYPTFQTPSISLSRPRLSSQRTKIDRSTEMRSRQKTIREGGSSKERMNPEMAAELVKIKKEISTQYTRLNQTKETHMKQCVSRTLQNIDTILVEMSSKILSDSSSDQ